MSHPAKPIKPAPEVKQPLPVKDQVEVLFMSHPLSDDQQERAMKLRQSARNYAQLLLECTEKSADQSAALRLIREANMTAIAAIALEGKL